MNDPVKEKSKPRAVTLPAHYDQYLDKVKLAWGWSRSETVRRALDLLMESTPVEGNVPTKTKR